MPTKKELLEENEELREKIREVRDELDNLLGEEEDEGEPEDEE